MGTPRRRLRRVWLPKMGCSISTGWACRSASVVRSAGALRREACVDGGGEEVVPVGVGGWEPAGGGVLEDELLEGDGRVRPRGRACEGFDGCGGRAWRW